MTKITELNPAANSDQSALWDKVSELHQCTDENGAARPGANFAALAIHYRDTVLQVRKVFDQQAHNFDPAAAFYGDEEKRKNLISLHEVVLENQSNSQTRELAEWAIENANTALVILEKTT